MLSKSSSNFPYLEYLKKLLDSKNGGSYNADISYVTGVMK